MRITCPNCSAQYEIAEGMIPATGRDVQCSNCGTTWFQEYRAAGALDDVTSDQPAVSPPPQETSAPASQPQPMADERTLDILREEREHEERARALDAEGKAGSAAETPDDRDSAAIEAARLSAAASVARARTPTPQPARPAPAPSAPDNDDVAAAIAQALKEGQLDEDDETGASDRDAGSSGKSSRRGLLPDIEEINSSLRPDDRAAEAQAEATAGTAGQSAVKSGRSGFRIGFLTVVFLVTAAFLVYGFAEEINEAIPALRPVLESYIGMIDRGRVSLESGAESLLELIGPEG